MGGRYIFLFFLVALCLMLRPSVRPHWPVRFSFSTRTRSGAFSPPPSLLVPMMPEGHEKKEGQCEVIMRYSEGRKRKRREAKDEKERQKRRTPSSPFLSPSPDVSSSCYVAAPRRGGRIAAGWAGGGRHGIEGVTGRRRRRLVFI
jgi:hypothetical protein